MSTRQLTEPTALIFQTSFTGDIAQLTNIVQIMCTIVHVRDYSMLAVKTPKSRSSDIYITLTNIMSPSFTRITLLEFLIIRRNVKSPLEC